MLDVKRQLLAFVCLDALGEMFAQTAGGAACVAVVLRANVRQNVHVVFAGRLTWPPSCILSGLMMPRRIHVLHVVDVWK